MLPAVKILYTPLRLCRPIHSFKRVFWVSLTGVFG